MAPLTSTGSAKDSAVIAGDYADNGFIILPDAISAEDVDALNAEAVQICRGDLGVVNGQDYVAAAGSSAELTDDDILRKYLCIHFPHKVSDVAKSAMTARRIVDVLTTLIGPNVKAMQSMLFVKSEGKPGQAWHQDEHFIPTRDRSLTAVWIALDDATIENGCLWVLPGSHRRGILYPDREQDDPRFDCTSEAYGFPYRDQDAIPVEIPAGTALIFNGYLLHRSLENSGKHGYRRALVNHYMSAESLLPWHEVPEGVAVAAHDFRDVVLVAGEDPYAYKGTTDVHRAHSRSDKDGGCLR